MQASYQTVSRVLNKSANVSEATRHKVEKSIECAVCARRSRPSNW